MRPQRERCGHERGSRALHRCGRERGRVCVCPCVSRVLVDAAVSEVVSVVSALGWVDERETRVKHRDLVANVPPSRGWRPELGRRPRR